MTLQASGNENTEIIQAQYTGAEEDPWLHGHAYRERNKAMGRNTDMTVFMASADYVLYWRIAAPDTLTVAQRDAALSGVRAGIQAYIDSRTEDELVGGQAALQAEIDRLQAQHSNSLITVVVDGLHYEVLDERSQVMD